MSSEPQIPGPAPRAHAESRANSNRKQEQNRTSGAGCDADSNRVITAESFYQHLAAAAIALHPLDGPERKARRHHRHLKRMNPSLAPAVHGAGLVMPDAAQPKTDFPHLRIAAE
jgi:hypothetical protein